jgi:hypothetical protein
MSENVRIYGKRYCATCEHSKSLENGRLIDPKSNRWVCFDCKPKNKNVSKQKPTGGSSPSTLPTL